VSSDFIAKAGDILDHLRDPSKIQKLARDVFRGPLSMSNEEEPAAAPASDSSSTIGNRRRILRQSAYASEGNI